MIISFTGKISFGEKSSSTLAKLSPDPEILFHANVYIFATMYLIEPLRQQSLATLHHDLCAYPLHKGNSQIILDLLDFVYANTGRAEPSGQSSIRDLVIQYVSCKIDILTKNKDFFTILDSDGEIGSDLMKKLYT